MLDVFHSRFLPISNPYVPAMTPFMIPSAPFSSALPFSKFILAIWSGNMKSNDSVL